MKLSNARHSIWNSTFSKSPDRDERTEERPDYEPDRSSDEAFAQEPLRSPEEAARDIEELDEVEDPDDLPGGDDYD